MGLFVCAAALILAPPGFGQQPPQATPDQTPASDGPKVVDPKLAPGERPPSAQEIRKREIDAYDPLAKDPRTKDADSTPDTAQDSAPPPAAPRPLPGSIAESNLPSPNGTEGPQVTGDAYSLEQQYNGPAVLSRSYTLTRPMVPKQVRWNWTVSAGETYTSGLVTSVTAPVSTGATPAGTVPNSASFGTTATFALHGRHLWKRDQIGVNYTGGYNQYASVSSYNGTNQTLNVDYSHAFSRHLQLNLVESASSISQNGTLSNPLAEPGVSVANINLAVSPSVEPLDQTTRQTTTQISLTWQKSARLSFDYSAGVFFVERTGQLLAGDSGYQAQTDVNYRLTRKTTIGAYYSYVTYVFSHHLSDSATDTAGLIYSYALGKSMQLRTRAGVSRIENNGLTEIAVSPSIAALVGQSYGIVDSYRLTYTSDISAQFIKDFGERRTGSLSYAHGVSPGNGTILTSTQQVISANYSMMFLRHYTISFALGQTELEATLGVIGKTVSDYASLSFSRLLPRNVAANVVFSYRTYSETGLASVQPQYVISSGVSWGPGEGRLW